MASQMFGGRQTYTCT